MKALILNSGTGSRMGELTKNTCKCLMEISNGITILDLQIKYLLEADIKEIIITTGAFQEKLKNHIANNYPYDIFRFVHNPLFDKTNYIYSMHLAAELVSDSDLFFIHGDLVFERSVLYDILASEKSTMTVDSKKNLPEKDFKAVIAYEYEKEKITKIGVNEFGDNAVYAQPMYKLLKADAHSLFKGIADFVSKGRTNEYAENVFNENEKQIKLTPLELSGRICFEIDNNEDLAYGREVYKRLEGQIFFYENAFENAVKILKSLYAKRPLVVCDKHFLPKATQVFEGFNPLYFYDFTPNPKYEEIIAGIKTFNDGECDFVVSIGGGSAIDVGKCINILDEKCGTENAVVKDCGNILNKPRSIMIAIPTTAGSGSESTSFAVIYKNNEKLSVEHTNMLSRYCLLDHTLLKTLPDYHKKSTLLDALCQAIESIWAKGATNESKAYAKKAIPLILSNVKAYISGDDNGDKAAKNVLLGANYAGRAINISKTTAAHAMSYKLSSMFGIAHGHAVALCLPHVWRELIESNIVNNELTEITNVFGCKIHEDAVTVFERLMSSFDLPTIKIKDMALINKLVAAVNLERLGNHPLDTCDLLGMYLQIL